MLSKTVRHARQKQIVKSALFQNYVFVQLDVGKARWRSINGTFGVSHLITCGDKPQPVPNQVMETLLNSVDGDGVVCIRPTLSVGQQIKVVDGPFVDFFGTLQQLDGSARARVFLQMLGRSVPVALSIEFLAAA